MAAGLLLLDDHLAKVVMLGTPFFLPVQYDRMFLDSVQYENLLHVFTNANSMERFPGYIIKCFYSAEFFLYFSYFCSKHRLWVHVRTTSLRPF